MPRPRLVLLPLLLAAVATAGCLGALDDGFADQASADAPDPGQEADEAFQGQPLPDEIGGVEKVTNLGPDDGLESGYQLEVEGTTAYVAAWGAGFYTVDVSDPTNPRVLDRVEEHFGHDVWLLHYEDGRTYAAVAGTSDGIGLVDVTDPTNITLDATVLGTDGPTDTGNVHNLAVAPDSHVIYNSRSVDAPRVDIVDASDPENPEVLERWNDLTCHDIAFHPPDDLAFCAGVRETQIWDVSDPASPEIVTRIANPAINIHHWAIPANDGDTLIIGDEFLGAAGPFAQACYGGTDDPATGGTTTDPVGALWFYDISNPEQPTPVSWLGADDFHPAPEPCTAHFGEIVEDRQKLVVGFLSGGVYTVDFGHRQAPRMIDHLDAGETVDVKIQDGWAFGVGRGRGLDVLSFTSASG
jgi:hypothetical protein